MVNQQKAKQSQQLQHITCMGGRGEYIDVKMESIPVSSDDDDAPPPQPLSMRGWYGDDAPPPQPLSTRGWYGFEERGRIDDSDGENSSDSEPGTYSAATHAVYANSHTAFPHPTGKVSPLKSYISPFAVAIERHRRRQAAMQAALAALSNRPLGPAMQAVVAQSHASFAVSAASAAHANAASSAEHPVIVSDDSDTQ